MEEELHRYTCFCGREMGIPPFHKEKLVSCPRCLSFLIVPAETGGLAGQPSLRFETARLQLRPAEPRDWRAWHEIHADSRNYDFEISDPVGVSESRKYLKASRYPRGFLKSKRLVFLATNEDGLVLGNVTVTFTQPYLTAVLGIMFHHDHQGRGYGAEAVGAVCDWLTRILGVEKVSAMCDSKNLACRRVLEKVGFKTEGIMEKFFHHPERGWLDSPVYALFREG